MKKNVFVALIALFVVFAGFQFAEPAAAVKIVDHGTNYGYNGQSGWMKVTWKTYQYNNNFLKTYATYYVKENGKYIVSFHETYTFAKVTKNTIKITDKTDSELGPPVVRTYVKTKLTAAQFYWRVYRHNIITL
jgi:hypothetical protein